MSQCKSEKHDKVQQESNQMLLHVGFDRLINSSLAKAKILTDWRDASSVPKPRYWNSENATVKTWCDSWNALLPDHSAPCSNPGVGPQITSAHWHLTLKLHGPDARTALSVDAALLPVCLTPVYPLLNGQGFHKIPFTPKKVTTKPPSSVPWSVTNQEVPQMLQFLQKGGRWQVAEGSKKVPSLHQNIQLCTLCTSFNAFFGFISYLWQLWCFFLISNQPFY